MVRPAALVSTPGPQTTFETVAIIFNQSNGNAITVADPNIGARQDTVLLQISNSATMLTVFDTSGLGSISGNDSPLLSMTGTIDGLNMALNGLDLQPHAGAADNEFLSVLLIPNNGAKSVSGGVPVDILANPTINVPASPLTVNGDLGTAFSTANGNPITVADPNIGNGTDSLFIQLADADIRPLGTLTLGHATGTVTGNGTASIIVTGTLAQLNSDLDGLRVMLPGLFQGPAFLSLTAFNNTYSADGTTHRSRSVSNRATSRPSLTAPTFQQQAGLLAFSAANGNPITVSDPDAGNGIDTVIVQHVCGPQAQREQPVRAVLDQRRRDQFNDHHRHDRHP